MFSVIQLPGSNDDRDMRYAMKSVLGCESRLVWHKDAELPAGTSAVLLPGGFSYGDYLRAGAMAAYSPVVAAVKRFADAGGPVLGVCNGFQVLCESGLLPGALMRNQHLHFVCDFVDLRVERSAAPFTSRAGEGDVLRIPIKHGEGAYTAPAETLAALERNGQVLLRYCENPNGSQNDIAGLCNEAGNVFGMMPHPEHAVEEAIGGTDGLAVLGSLADALRARGSA